MDFDTLLGSVVKEIDNFNFKREERSSDLLKSFKTMQANALDTPKTEVK